MAAYDALHDGETLFFSVHRDTWRVPDEVGLLADQLEQAITVDPNFISPRLRVVLQGDVWGLLQRADSLDFSSRSLERVQLAARTLLRQLALSAGQLAPLKADGTVPSALPTNMRWAEMGTPFQVLMHEWAFDLRRTFRIFHMPGQQALVSQLIALDREGIPHVTSIVGDVEILDVSGEAPRGLLVRHLDRRSLRCRGRDHGLADVTSVAHVPGLGANSFFVEFSPPVPLDENPCARCHADHDSSASPELDSQRVSNLLIDARKSAAHYFR